ncbi:Replication protein A 70 kDa DNA-binding subunit E [Spatholobus suberectus]|nr:Replication protein A 70 kDa DNA-binding subunit E [Spatholobus suberectus]
MDAKGGKIEASIRKPMIKKFAKVIVEGEVYAMAYFSVVNNYGSYRVTRHEFKLLFNSKTNVLSCESAIIPSFGFTLMDSEHITKTKGESDYLLDVMGVLIGVYAEKSFVKGGKTSRVIVLELANHKGIIKCALFGDYVDMVNDFLAIGSAQRPVVVLQLGRVKSYKGQVNVHNVMNASRLLWDPQIPKAIEFRNGDKDGMSMLHNEFLKTFPRKSVNDLQISVVIKGDTWWYMACKCHKAVAPDGGLYYCPGCDSHVIDVTPCFKLKPEVSDGKDAACFILFDFDCYALLKKSCKELLYTMKDPSFVEHPPECDSLIGRELLFKVEKQADRAYRYEDSFKLKMRSIPSSLPAVGEVGVLLEELSKGQTSLSQIEIGTIGLGESSSTSFQSIDRNKGRVNTHLESVMLQLSNNESTALRLLELTAIPLGDGVGNVDAEVDDLNEKVEVVSECSNGRRKRIKLKPVKLEQYKC